MMHSPGQTRARGLSLLPAVLLLAGAGLLAWVLLGRRNTGGRRARRGTFASLSNAIIGTSKEAVAGVFGPPRAAAMGAPAPVTMNDRPPYWNADTWYYLLDKRTQFGMAIEFVEGRAAKVDHIQNPRSGTKVRKVNG
jgi:hypothetical protein